MNNRLVLSSCAAAILSLTVAAAQTTTQTPTQSPVQGSTQGTTGQVRVGTGSEASTQVTVTGCVVRESEHTNARGGVLGTGAGAGNEFVLANVMTGRNDATARAQIAGGVSGSTSAKSEAEGGGSGSTAVGTSGIGAGTTGAATARSTPGAAAYSLTGSRESDLAQHVGKRVEIIGTVAGTPRGTGTSASVGADAAGASVQAGAAAQGQTAGNMQQLTIVSFRPVEGACQ
jgi:hypothetical protein